MFYLKEKCIVENKWQKIICKVNIKGSEYNIFSCVRLDLGGLEYNIYLKCIVGEICYCRMIKILLEKEIYLYLYIYLLFQNIKSKY